MTTPSGLVDDSDAVVIVSGLIGWESSLVTGFFWTGIWVADFLHRVLTGDKLAEDRVVVAERVGRAGVDEELRIIRVRPARVGQRQLVDAGECQLLNIFVGKGRAWAVRSNRCR